VESLYTSTAQLLNLLSRHSGRHRCSLRDAVFHNSKVFQSGTFKQVSALNTTVTFIRHLTAAQLDELTLKVAAELEQENVSAHQTSLEVDLLVAKDPWQAATPEFMASCSVARNAAELSDNSCCIGGPLARVGVQTASAAKLTHDSVTQTGVEAIAADSFAVPGSDGDEPLQLAQTDGASEVAASLADLRCARDREGGGRRLG
jgi:hypothetical protein